LPKTTKERMTIIYKQENYHSLLGRRGAEALLLHFHSQKRYFPKEEKIAGEGVLFAYQQLATCWHSMLTN
jgi:hypothetical protein